MWKKTRWEGAEVAFALKPGESVVEGIRRIAREQLEGAAEGLKGRTESSTEEVVHDARKRFKRVRALLRLVRGGLGRKVVHREDVRVRDLGRSLASSRDSEVLLRTFESLVVNADSDSDSEKNRGPDAFEEVRERLERHRQEVHDEALNTSDLLEQSANTVFEALESTEDWPFRKEAWAALAPGLRWIYKEGRRAARAAKKNPTDEALHDWRKRVKDYWHALEVLQPLRPDWLETQANKTHHLADLLGDDHDLAVLRAFLESPAEAQELQNRQALDDLFSRIDNRRSKLREEAFDLGRQLYQDRSSVTLKRFKTFWNACEAEKEARSGVDS